MANNDISVLSFDRKCHASKMSEMNKHIDPVFLKEALEKYLKWDVHCHNWIEN